MTFIKYILLAILLIISLIIHAAPGTPPPPPAAPPGFPLPGIVIIAVSSIAFGVYQKWKKNK